MYPSFSADVILDDMYPSFSAEGSVDPVAESYVAGWIKQRVLQTGVVADASGGFACGNSRNITVTISTGVQITFGPNPGCQQHLARVSDVKAGMYRGTRLDVRCDLGLEIKAWANGGLFSTAKAYAKLYGAEPCLRITAYCEDCQSICPEFNEEFGCGP